MKIMRMKRFLTIVATLLVVIIIIFGYKIVQTYIEDKQERANYQSTTKISNADEQTSRTCETTI